MSTPLYLIFDMDGVLVDNHGHYIKAWNQFCERHGHAPEEEAFVSHINGRTKTKTASLTTTLTAVELKSSNPALIIRNFSQLETKQLLNLVIPGTND